MLTATFIHAPGVGPATEQSLWAQGATSWQAYLDRADELRLAPRHKIALRQTVEDSVAALEEARADFFAQALPEARTLAGGFALSENRLSGH